MDFFNVILIEICETGSLSKQFITTSFLHRFFFSMQCMTKFDGNSKLKKICQFSYRFF